jgi:hypothetical protein
LNLSFCEFCVDFPEEGPPEVPLAEIGASAVSFQSIQQDEVQLAGDVEQLVP